VQHHEIIESLSLMVLLCFQGQTTGSCQRISCLLICCCLILRWCWHIGWRCLRVNRGLNLSSSLSTVSCSVDLILIRESSCFIHHLLDILPCRRIFQIFKFWSPIHINIRIQILGVDVLKPLKFTWAHFD
jgi:hypothetical protein